MWDKSKKERTEAVVEVLNEARKMELHAIVQYMNQHYALDDMDYGELAGKVKLIAIDEMKHAEDFGERVKVLGGEPTTERAAEVEPNQPVERIFEFDSGLEEKTVDEYNRFAAICRENGDSTSAKLFERIIADEQAHLGYFDDVGNHIGQLKEAFLARKAGTSLDTGCDSLGFVSSGDKE
jgi:bacterioferritin